MARKTKSASKTKQPAQSARGKEQLTPGQHSKPYLIDTHCHLHDQEYYTQPMALDLLHRAYTKGVRKVICIGTTLEDSYDARDLAFTVTKENVIRRARKGPLDLRMKFQKYPKVGWTFGLHPDEAKNIKIARQLGREARENMEDYLRHAYLSKITRDGEPSDEPDFGSEFPDAPGDVKIFHLASALGLMPVGIGEVGLDYHREFSRVAQIRLLEDMLGIAHKYNLPVSFHVREAFDDFFPVVANYPHLQGVVHSFSDNKKNLQRILNETEFYVGVNGMATYSTLPTPPLSRIILETDAPFLTPKPFRGIINEPGYVRATAEWLAGKLGVGIETIEQETTRNAEQLFRI